MINNNQEYLNKMCFIDDKGDPVKRDTQWVEWISVKDRTPEDLQEVLFTDKKEIYKGYRISSNIDELFSWYSTTDFTISDVTHWMSLPSLPNNKQESNEK